MRDKCAAKRLTSMPIWKMASKKNVLQKRKARDGITHKCSQQCLCCLVDQPLRLTHPLARYKTVDNPVTKTIAPLTSIQMTSKVSLAFIWQKKRKETH